jgi:4-amino-4-deoxy-L-arabinose transferase-like glycosyltransferase
MTTAGSRRIHGSALAAVLLLTAVALVFLGGRQPIGYDSYWHVFIARQDRWPNFWQEVRDNAHPPLFYLLLRVASAWLGSNLLAYRAISIAATVCSACLIAAIVRRTTSGRSLAIVAAAAFGLSYGAIMMGMEVRAYSLCAAFTLLAFLFYLDWLRRPARRVSGWTCAGFALAATAAVLTHYSTFFFLAAALATPAILALIDRRWRRRLVRTVGARPLATALMFGAPLAVATAAYVVHVKLWGGGRINHVPEYMLNPAAESPAAFLLRNTLNLAAIVLPGGNEFIAGIYNPLQRVAIVLIGGIALLGAVQLGRARASRLAAVPVVCLGVMIVLNAAGGLAGRYPFGGASRHEFFLVPFVQIVVFSLIDVARRGLARPYNRRAIWIPAVACGVLASVASWVSAFRIQPQALFQAQMNHFRALVPSPRAVLVDQFTFINFFSHHHDWKWRLGGQWKDESVWQVWLVSKEDRRFAVCRDAEWSLDMSSVRTFESVAECGHRSGVGRVAIFRTHWWDAPAKLATFDGALAAENGLTTTVLAADGNDVYAEFDIDPAILRDCVAAPPAPAGLHVVSNSGRVVVLAWEPSGGTRTTYILEAGNAPGRTDALRIPVRRTTTYTAENVNPATYYARVRAKNICGLSDPSAELSVTVQ